MTSSLNQQDIEERYNVSESGENMAYNNIIIPVCKYIYMYMLQSYLQSPHYYCSLVLSLYTDPLLLEVEVSELRDELHQMKAALSAVLDRVAQLEQQVKAPPSWSMREQPSRPAWEQPSPSAWEQPSPSAWEQPPRPAWEQPSRPAWEQPSRPAWEQPSPSAWQQPSRPAWEQPTEQQPSYELQEPFEEPNVDWSPSGRQANGKGSQDSHRCFPVALTAKASSNALPSSSINREADELIAPETIVQKFPHLRNPSKVATLAVKLAMRSFFGPRVLARCTPKGFRDLPGLPVAELGMLKQVVFDLLPQYWATPNEFEPLWLKCEDSIGQACKRLRKHNPVQITL